MMLVSIRSSLLLILVASACGGSVARMGGDDDDPIDGGGPQALQCSSALACPAPSAGTKQTICGQLFDLENNAKLADGLTGVPCTSPTTSGACSLAITPYDALAFAQNPWSSNPLAHGAVEIDSCGRYRVSDIETSGTSPFLGLVIDDAAGRGPTGTTVTTVVATFKIAGSATDQLEAWIVREATTTQWAASGGPALAGGVYVPVFRAHQLGTPQTDPFAPQAGVTVTRAGNPVQQYYFDAAVVDRTTIDTQAATTGANGTALIINASINESVAYAGMGGLSDANCRWHPHVGMSQPNIVFVQIFRPISVVNATCSL